jgi:hypothetical protein
VTPFIVRSRYYGPEGELLVIAITASDGGPVATCIAADGEMVAKGIDDLRVLYRAMDWPVTDDSLFVGEPRRAEVA